MVKDRKMNKKEFADLLLTFLAGNTVREMLLDESSQGSKKLDSQLEFMLNLAEKLGFSALVDNFHGSKLPITSICLKEEEIIREYDDQQFWENLEVRLGQRDFYNSLSDEEEKEVANSFWLPDEIYGFYEKYSSEFEKYGVDRLRIVADGDGKN